MLSITNKTPNGVAISAVYTADAFRGRGYASNAVAAASQRELDLGRKFCTLVADREPSAAIRIYQRVGFRRLREHLLVDLER
jgi:predicted GNAT family acetyltransferase